MSRFRRYLNPRFSRHTGVTLIELLVVAIVMGILAGVAVPGYRKALERAYFREAEDLLLTIYSGQRAYFFMNGFYLDEPSSMAEWRLLHMDDPTITATIPVTFSVSSNSPLFTTFTAIATRDGTAVCGGDVRTIDEDRVFGPASGPTAWQDCSGL